MFFTLICQDYGTKMVVVVNRN